MSELTDKEKELIEDAFNGYCDCGPEGFGWKSEELKSAIKKSI